MDDQQAVEQTPETDMGTAYDAIVSRLGGDTEDAPEDAPEPPVEAQEAEPEAAPEEDQPEEVGDEADEPENEAPQAEIPSDVPGAIRAHWNEIPEAARDAVMAAHRDLSGKLSHQGRLIQGLKPIETAIVDMAKQHPALANMDVPQVINEMKSLAEVSAKLNTDPVGAIMGVVKQHGLEAALSQALQGQQPDTSAQKHVAALNSEIRELKARLDKTDQTFEQQRIDAVSAEVNKFASTAENWSEVESLIPALIPLAEQEVGAGASPTDILAKAHELALKVKAPKAVAAPKEQPDPERVQAVKKARSVNVKGSAGERRPLSEREQMAVLYDKLNQE